MHITSYHCSLDRHFAELGCFFFLSPTCVRECTFDIQYAVRGTMQITTTETLKRMQSSFASSGRTYMRGGPIDVSMNAWVEAKRLAGCSTGVAKVNGVAVIGLPSVMDIGSTAKGTCSPTEGKGIVTFQCKDGSLIPVGGGCKSKFFGNAHAHCLFVIFVAGFIVFFFFCCLFCFCYLLCFSGVECCCYRLFTCFFVHLVSGNVDEVMETDLDKQGYQGVCLHLPFSLMVTNLVSAPAGLKIKRNTAVISLGKDGDVRMW